MPWQKTADMVAALGGMTAAMKAQRTLLGAGIVSEVVALEPTATKRGCAYGVAFPREQLPTVRNTLRRAHIPVTEYTEREVLP